MKRLRLANGVDIKTMSAQLGHSRIAITADTYSHVTRRLDGDAAARVGDGMRDAARELSETAALRRVTK